MTVAVYEPSTASLDLFPQAWDLAQRIAATEFVPTSLRNKPEAVMACMLVGNEVGIGPMQALSKIHVVQGRPAMAAELMRALALRAGHEVWIEESTITKCTVGGKRNGSTRETRMTWTMDDAKRAGLAGKDNYRHYPAAMLLARASAALCRAIFPEVLAGISYCIEEIEDGDFVDIDATLDDDDDAPKAARKKATRTRKATKAITATAPSAESEPDATPKAEAPPLPGEEYEGVDQHLDGGPMLPWPQWAGMTAGKVGIEDDETRHGLWLAITGGRVDRAAELTTHERMVARGVLNGLGHGEISLAATGPAEDHATVWAVLEATGAVRCGSGPTTEPFTVVAGHGAPEPQTASPSDVIHGPASPEASPGTTGPDATPRPPTPAEGPETGPPGTEAEWRSLMRARSIKVIDLARIASEVRPDVGGVSASTLVKDPELGAAIYARIIEGA
ncbi:MAG: hypothetical protein WEA75_04740 [Acidimicrobiia bacterium]